MDKDKRSFIEFMIEAGVLRFGDFTTKSGRRTSYFVNTGNYFYGSHMAKLGKFYAGMIKKNAGEFNAMFGPAYKGITLAAVTASALYTEHGLDVPYFFNRKEAKDHGEGGSLVGYKPSDGDRIIIIEDVITAGLTINESFELLKNIADVKVTDMFISVDRCEVGTEGTKTAVEEVKERFGINIHNIVNVFDIKDYLSETGNLDGVEKIDGYIKKYCVMI